MSTNYDFEESFMAGTTTVQAADTSGWIVSITPAQQIALHRENHNSQNF